MLVVAGGGYIWIAGRILKNRLIEVLGLLICVVALLLQPSPVTKLSTALFLLTLVRKKEKVPTLETVFRQNPLLLFPFIFGTAPEGFRADKFGTLAPMLEVLYNISIPQPYRTADELSQSNPTFGILYKATKETQDIAIAQLLSLYTPTVKRNTLLMTISAVVMFFIAIISVIALVIASTGVLSVIEEMP